MLALLQLGLCMLVAMLTLKLHRLPDVEIAERELEELVAEVESGVGVASVPHPDTVLLTLATPCNGYKR